MLPTTIPAIRVYRGDDLDFPVLTFTHGGAPLDLTGATIAAQWRTAVDASAAVDITVTVDDPETGVVRLALTAEQTKGMTGGGVWDLQIVTSEHTRTLVRGTTELVKDVTR